ncbi:MAG: carboxypeptidase-like regulatory domain-containing protein [Bacteroidota bacterium]
MKNLLLYTLLATIFLTACEEDIYEVTNTTSVEDPIIELWEAPTELIQGDLTGFVVNELGAPVSQAQIQLNNLTATTDRFGHFFFENVEMNALGTLVRISKAGYFPGSRRFFPVAGEENRVKIELIDQRFDQSFSTSAGGTILLSNGGEVVFSPNSISRADGSSYEGDVQVAVGWVGNQNRMPGNLQGLNSQVEYVGLVSYGMMAVELQSPSGETLNLLDDHPAILNFPIRPSYWTDAPAEVPLWSYNEEHGLWVEEGLATRQGNTYVGEVSHFSFWNCDLPFEPIFLRLRLADSNGAPIVNQYVSLSFVPVGQTNIISSTGYTGGNGELAGYVPSGYPLTLRVSSECVGIIQEQIIGPFSENTDLGTITIENTLANNFSVSGQLVDCEGAPINNGVIILEQEGGELISYLYPGDANFSATISSCSFTNVLRLFAFDTENLIQSAPITLPSEGNIDLGNLTVCGDELSNYFRLNVTQGGELNTRTYFDIQVAEAFEDQFTKIKIGTPATPHFGILQFQGTSPGDYSGNHSIDSLYDAGPPWFLDDGPFESLEITEYTNTTPQGQFIGTISGNFSGTLTNFSSTNSEEVQVSGEFSVTQE